MGDEQDVECNGLGEILYQDEDNRRFYSGFQIDSLSVHVGDCVRVQLQADSDDSTFAVAQVLAVFETSDEEMMTEVRWLSFSHELSLKLRQM